MDWFEKDYVKFGTSSNGFGVFAKQKREHHKVKGSNGVIVGRLQGEHVTKHQATYGDKHALRYTVNIRNDEYINLENHWTGRINHSPSNHDGCNLKAVEDKLYQTKLIHEGDELRYDYGLDYWVFQVTGLDVDDWLRTHPSSMRLWKRMHENTTDYGLLLKLPIDKLPAKDVISLIDKLVV